MRPILKNFTATKIQEESLDGQLKTMPVENNDRFSEVNPAHEREPQIVNISFRDMDHQANSSKKSGSMMSKLAMARRKSIENIQV